MLLDKVWVVIRLTASIATISVLDSLGALGGLLIAEAVEEGSLLLFLFTFLI